MLTSARRGIVYPNTNRADTPDVPRDIAALVAALEIDVIYGQGTLAARPVSTSGSPGIAGRLYMATDQTPHALYYDYGTGWDPVGALSAGSVGTTQLADGAVTQLKLANNSVGAAQVIDGSIGAAEIADNSLTALKLVDALVPSRGAGAATEALRAIGSGAGNVVAGNDARLTDQRTPLDGSVTSAKIAPQTVASVNTSFTPVASDRFKLFVVDTNGGARTVTLPPDSTAFQVGESMDFLQLGGNQIIFAAGAGVTLNGNPGLKSNGSMTMVTAIKISSNWWVVVGNLTP